jgi:hypothetical protein
MLAEHPYLRHVALVIAADVVALIAAGIAGYGPWWAVIIIAGSTVVVVEGIADIALRLRRRRRRRAAPEEPFSAGGRAGRG